MKPLKCIDNKPTIERPTVTAKVVPFPLARRQDMIARQSSFAAELTPGAAERFVQQQIHIQMAVMRRRGVDEGLVQRELKFMEEAIRRRLASTDSGESSA